MAVCDSETAYAHGLADYLSSRNSFPFQVQVFTSIHTLEEFTLRQPVTLALVAEKDYEQETGKLPVEHIVILKEGRKEIRGEIKMLDKYQSSGHLLKELMEWVSREGIITRPAGCSSELKLIGIYSPVGRCLKTSFAYVLGQLLGKKHKVLYLNMESYSGLGRLLEREFTTDLSQLIYYLQNSREKFAYRLSSMVEQAGNLDILPPFGSYLDFISVSGEEWIQLFGEIEQGSDYEYLILDLSDAVQGLFDILRLCDLVYTLSRDDGFSMAKIAQYEEVLTRSSYEDIWQKTKQYTLPEIKNLPHRLGQLTYTELADYVRERMEEDFHD
jgi:cellulose biosynthesis protein BcsQ